MKVKKIQSILLVVGFAAVLLGFAVFFALPMLIGKGFEYNGMQVFTAGVKSLFSFNFNDVLATLFCVLVLVTFVCVIIWAIIIGAKKRKIHYIAMIFDFIAVVLLFALLASYFVPEVSLNSDKGFLFNMIMDVEGQTTGKILSMVVLVLLYIGLMFLTLYGFLDISAMVLGSKLADGIVKVEEKVDDPLEGLEDRKAREEAFFKACIETGEYTQYDELEFPEPLEGYTEEPVFEETVVEENSKVIERSKVVKVTKQQTFQVK